MKGCCGAPINFKFLQYIYITLCMKFAKISFHIGLCNMYKACQNMYTAQDEGKTTLMHRSWYSQDVCHIAVCDNCTALNITFQQRAAKHVTGHPACFSRNIKAHSKLWSLSGVFEAVNDCNVENATYSNLLSHKTLHYGVLSYKK